LKKAENMLFKNYIFLFLIVVLVVILAIPAEWVANHVPHGIIGLLIFIGYIFFIFIIFCFLIIKVGNNLMHAESYIKHMKLRCPPKEEIIKQIDLGLSLIEESQENFIKLNPGKIPEENLSICGESSLKQVQLLKKLKDDLINYKISSTDAWKIILDISYRIDE
jgi:hypothetical protein